MKKYLYFLSFYPVARSKKSSYVAGNTQQARGNSSDRLIEKLEANRDI
ncbi:hypothetical protein [Okeania sp. SIO2B3]|nr:hypothetical protein [Okeania sp. SIO2B3]